MPILRTLDSSFWVPKLEYFVLKLARLGECNAITDEDFDAIFLNQKEPPVEGTWLQIYWIGRDTEIDDIKSALGNKLHIRLAQCHDLIKRQCNGEDSLLPTGNDQQLMVLFVKDKSGATREVTIAHQKEEGVWKVEAPGDSEEFEAGTLFLAQADAL